METLRMENDRMRQENEGYRISFDSKGREDNELLKRELMFYKNRVEEVEADIETLILDN